MANQGCPNEGSDTRLFGKWGCWIQQKLSFKCPMHPASVLICFPPYVAFNIYVPFAPADRKYLSVRAGWRYDVNWGGFLFPEAILKMKDRPLFY